MTASQIARIAVRQLDDYDAHAPGGIFAEADLALSLEQAYDVQQAVAELRLERGEAIAGYKIGCVSQTVQEQLGITQPVFGHIFASELYHSGVALDIGRFSELAIEGEIAVRLGHGLSIESVFPVVELHNAVFRGPGPRVVELVANNALQAGVVLPLEKSPDGGTTIEVYRNGELLGAAGAHDLRASIEVVARHVSSRGGTLRPGQIVLTGSRLPLYPASPGDRFAVRGGRTAVVELVLLPRL